MTLSIVFMKERRELTQAENACVQTTQKRAICVGNSANCSRIVIKSADALLYPAKNDGAYWLRKGSVGWSFSALAKKHRWT